MKARNIIILGAVVLAVVIVAILVLQNAPLPATPGTQPTASTTPVPSSAARPTTPGPQATANATATPAPGMNTEAPAPDPGLTEAQRKIEAALTSKASETEIAQQLINQLPGMPPEGQAEATDHITNLILDKDYNRVLPLLRNPALAREVQDKLVTDLMNRSNPVKLPALLDVAKMPNHPYQEEALNDLQIFIGEDYGNNWAKWDAAVKGLLKKEAAEEAGTAPQ